MGIVRRAGECTPLRISWGTQYSKSPSESLTQPFTSGFAQRARCLGDNGKGGWGLMEMSLTHEWFDQKIQE